MPEQQYQRFQQNDTIEGICVRANNAFTSDTSSSCCVLMDDIRDVFPQAIRFKLNGNPIPFLIDLDGRRIEPLRIAFYPDDILEVITGISTNTSVVVYSPANKESNIQSSQQILSTSSSLLQSLDSSQDAGEYEQAELIKSDLALNLGAIEKYMAASNESSQEMIQMQKVITNSLDRMMLMQLEAKEKDDKMILMQDQLLDLQNKTLDRLAILQKHVHAILVQNFELHEYPVPRLFIILPVDKSKWDSTRILENKFRLHFLCECGDYTIGSSKSNENRIHLANHEGYEIKNGTEFLKKYGKYILILMRGLKMGMQSVDVSMPHISTLSNVGIDYSISYMEALSVDNPSLSGITTIEDYEELGGADLRQLVTFLRVNNQDEKLGNLYRVATESGHVQWVCFDHYRATYKEKERIALTNIVKANSGEYDEELGRVVISLGSRIMAQEFFHALVKARHVYELDVTFDWNCSTSDLEALEKALRMSTVSILRLDIRHFQASVARKLLPASRHYERITRIIEQKTVKVIHIVLSKDFIKLSSLQSRKSSDFQKLSFEMICESLGSSDFRFLVNSLKTNTALTVLSLWGNSVDQEGALALSEALKINTTLTTLGLWSNSIGKEGALALSQALKSNTTLTTLNLAGNSIGKEGALALSQALKINTTLTTLNLAGNSIGKEGALALSQALKTNTTLITLNLEFNSIGKEGALALSQALKTNTTLTTLNLAGNSIGKEGALALSQALKSNTTLTTLNLAGNSIEKEGALALSQALKINTTLTTLILRGNSIGKEGDLALSEAIKTNTTLTTLDLEENSIGSEGALAFAKAHKTNCTSTTPALEQNSTGSGKALALTNASKTITNSNSPESNKNLGKTGKTILGTLKAKATMATSILRKNSTGNEGKSNNNPGILNLDHPIPEEGVPAFSEASKDRNSTGNEGKANNNPDTLNLRNSPSPEEEVPAFSEAPKDNNSTGNEGKPNNNSDTLNLDHNPILEEEVLAFSEALKDRNSTGNEEKPNSNSDTLNLGNNPIPEEVPAFSEALKDNNSTGNEGKPNNNSDTLNLDHSPIPEEEAPALSEAPKDRNSTGNEGKSNKNSDTSNNSSDTLSLENSPIPEEEVPAFSEAPKDRNSTGEGGVLALEQ